MELDAQEVLQREHHSVKKINLSVKPWQVETTQEPFQVGNSEAPLHSPLVVLENVQETTKDYMLIMLVENISGLSEEDGHFSVEMIPEIKAAVVAFTGSTGKEKSGLQISIMSYFSVCGRETKWEMKNILSLA